MPLGNEASAAVSCLPLCMPILQVDGIGHQGFDTIFQLNSHLPFLTFADCKTGAQQGPL